VLEKELEQKENDIQNTEEECSASKMQMNLLETEVDNLKVSKKIKEPFLNEKNLIIECVES
jgi:hypothetical protein